MKPTYVKYRKFIPAEYPEDTFTFKQGTNKMSDFIFTGILIHWGVTFVECNNGVGQQTVAIVQDDNGYFHEVHPTDLQEYDQLKEWEAENLI